MLMYSPKRQQKSGRRLQCALAALCRSPQFKNRLSFLRVMWFCTYFKTPTRGHAKWLSPYQVKHWRILPLIICHVSWRFWWLCHCLKTLQSHHQIADGHITPPPQKHLNTGRIDWGLHGGQCSSGNFLIYHLQLQFSTSNTSVVEETAYMSLLLQSYYLVPSAEGDTDQSFFLSLQEILCHSNSVSFSVSKSWTLLLCVP